MTVAPVRRLARSGRKESDLQAAILAVFRAHGIVMWKANREKAGPRYAPHFGFRGMPDLCGVLPGGRAFFCEVKRPGEQLTPHQRGALEMLAKQGALVCVVRSVEDAHGLAQAITAELRRLREGSGG